MKIEQLLVQHFYNAGEVTLQGMGTFTLSPDFVMPKEQDKDLEIPSNAILFQYNSKATEDDGLINYIVEQTRKMKALASADLDSYLVLGKQFLNIGKLFAIEGLGVLAKTQQGEYEFTQGHAFNAKLQTAPAAVKEQREHAEISFASESKTENNSKKIILIVLAIIGLGLLATAAWYFFIKNNNGPVENITEQPVALPDTAKIDSLKTDSMLSAKTITTVANDGYTFKVVFLVTADSAAAVYRKNVLTMRKHTIIMYKNDAYYKLAEPFTLPLADTTHIKDSLNNFYYSGKAFIELK